MNLSLKLAVPSIALVVLGIALVLIAGKGDAELRGIGIGAIGSGVAALGLGSRIPPAPDVTQAQVNELTHDPETRAKLERRANSRR